MIAGSEATDWSAEEAKRGSPVLGFLGDIMRGNIHLPGSAVTLWTILVSLFCTLTLGLVCVLAIHGIHVHHGEADVAKVPSAASSIPLVAGSRVGEGASRSQSARPADGIPSPFFPLAQLTRTAECRWTDAASSHEVGASFVAGQGIHLASGAIELVFDVGVRAIVQGPARMDLIAPGKVFLHAGKMSSEIISPRPEASKCRRPKARSST